MPAERLSMRTIREVLRLKWQEKLSHQQIAASCRIARSIAAPPQLAGHRVVDVVARSAALGGDPADAAHVRVVAG